MNNTLVTNEINDITKHIPLKTTNTGSTIIGTLVL